MKTLTGTWAITALALASMPIVLPGTLMAIGTRAGTSPAAADARTTYNAQCVICHGRDGRGKTARGRRTHARDLTEASWQEDVSDERLFNSVMNGRGKMPAFKKKLSESEIDALVSYVRRMRR